MANNTPSSVASKKRCQGVPLNAYIPYDMIWLKGEIEALAVADHRSVSEIVVMALQDFAEKNKKKK